MRELFLPDLMKFTDWLCVTLCVLIVCSAAIYDISQNGQVKQPTWKQGSEWISKQHR